MAISTSVSLDPSSFDLITLWDVIEHLEDPARAIATRFRALKENGALVMTTPTRRHHSQN